VWGGTSTEKFKSKKRTSPGARERFFTNSRTKRVGGRRRAVGESKEKKKQKKKNVQIERGKIVLYAVV